jgi:hypothetical protein
MIPRLKSQVYLLISIEESSTALCMAGALRFECVASGVGGRCRLISPDQVTGFAELDFFGSLQEGIPPALGLFL